MELFDYAKAGIPKQKTLFYGADYNPDQWQDYPDILERDIELMKQAGVTSASVGIFAWTALEPEEGRFTFGWLDRVMDRFADEGMFVFLATPSGRMPMWMQEKYPGIIRVRSDGTVDPELERHNHCMTSPVYRQHVATINRALAGQFKDHPALALWHLGNELNGDCHCEICRAAFHQWLEKKYGSLDALNAAWWSAFWSYTFTDWSQIPTHSESNDGLLLDWRRFANDQHVSFLLNEMAPLKELTPGIPCTTNFMGTHPDTNYIQWARHLDVISNDMYPLPDDRENTWKQSLRADFIHSLMRGMSGGKPWMQMECSPSVVNWADINKLKRPGAHRQEVLQMIANGADTIQYFQWRKGRGGYEKFHGAVIDHEGGTGTRVFKDCAAIGDELRTLAPVLGHDCPKADVALLFDWEVRWALDVSCGPKRRFSAYPFPNDIYTDACLSHHQALASTGLSVDVLACDADFSGYRVVVTPALYMLSEELAQRLTDFTRNGGIWIATCLSGYVDMSNRCWLGGFPGPGLRPVFGIWNEEMDYLFDEERVAVVDAEDQPIGTALDMVEVVHAEGAEVLARTGSEFYAGSAVLTTNPHGQGHACYIAAKLDDAALKTLYNGLADRFKVQRSMPSNLPEGVVVRYRESSEGLVGFIFNYRNTAQEVRLEGMRLADFLTGEPKPETVRLEPYAVLLIRQFSG